MVQLQAPRPLISTLATPSTQRKQMAI